MGSIVKEGYLVIPSLSTQLYQAGLGLEHMQTALLSPRWNVKPEFTNAERHFEKKVQG